MPPVAAKDKVKPTPDKEDESKKRKPRKLKEIPDPSTITAKGTKVELTTGTSTKPSPFSSSKATPQNKVYLAVGSKKSNTTPKLGSAPTVATVAASKAPIAPSKKDPRSEPAVSQRPAPKTSSPAVKSPTKKPPLKLEVRYNTTALPTHAKSSHSKGSTADVSARETASASESLASARARATPDIEFQIQSPAQSIAKKPARTLPSGATAGVRKKPRKLERRGTEAKTPSYGSASQDVGPVEGHITLSKKAGKKPAGPLSNPPSPSTDSERPFSEGQSLESSEPSQSIDSEHSVSTVMTDLPKRKVTMWRVPENKRRIRRDDWAKIDERFEAEAWRLHHKGKRSPGILMLMEKQGCTFGWDKRFKTETGDFIQVNNFRDARVEGRTFKTKHITYYGEDIQYIGTKGCLSCLGVYFEITHGRLFCAHMNVWVNRERSWQGVADDPVPEGTKYYKEIKRAIVEKMREESRQYGWNASDYVDDTLRMCCPYFDMVGHAVAAGVLEFLAEPEDWECSSAHAFVIKPGTVGHDHETMELFFQKGSDPITGAQIFEDIPLRVHQPKLLDPDGIPRGSFAYTLGDRRNWGEPRLCDREFRGGKWVNIAKELFKE